MDIDNFRKDDDKYVSVSGKAMKFDKKVDRGYYTVQFAKDCLDEFVMNESRPAGKGSVMITDHDMKISNVIAREDNGTFRWRLKMDKRAFLYYDALIPNENQTQMQKEVLRLYDQGLINQTSVGVAEWTYEWEDLESDMPNLLITKARLREISVVVYGAFENDANIRMTLGDSFENNSREVVNLRMYDDASPSGMFDAKTSLENARAELQLEQQKQENIKLKEDLLAELADQQTEGDK